MQSLTLKRDQLQRMIEDVDLHAPSEACGLLAGKDARVEKMIAVRNQAQDPARYVMDPIEQLTAFKWIDSHALELIGIFHSHPRGPAIVSPTDIRECAYAVVQVILSRGPGVWQARGFWIEADGFHEVQLQIE
jgi:proteasome lid subunit RPN8/RPN11